MRRGRDIESSAIVLKSRTMGENDLWADLLTPDYGRFHGVARHGRKSQKRFGTVLEPLNWVRFRARDAGGMVTLLEASLVQPWRRLDTSLALLTSGFHALELIRQLVPERNADERVFKLVVDCLAELDRPETSEGDGVRAAIARFEYRMLDASGFGPNLKQCLGCQRPRGREETFSFVYKEGGLYCAACLKPGLVFDPFTRRSASEILSKFVEYQLGKPLKTRKFLTDQAFCG